MSCCDAPAEPCRALVEIVGRHVGVGAESIKVDASLLAQGLDSMSAIELVLDIEQSLGVVFADDLLVAETFETVTTLHTVVAQLPADAA